MTESDTQKVVINRRHGGFGISEEAAEWLIEEKGWETTQWEDGTYADDSADLVDRKAGPEGKETVLGGRYSFVGSRRDADLRTNPDLVKCVEELGEAANGRHASLEVVEIPAGVAFEIQEYDGVEWVAEEHRTWP